MTVHPLEQLLAPVARVPTVDRERTDGARRWFRSDDWRLLARPLIEGDGAPFRRFERDGDGRVEARVADGTVTIPFNLRDAYETYVMEQWREARPPHALAPWQLALFYRVKRLIPRWAQLRARRTLIRRQGPPDFPRWPYDDGVERLLRFYAQCLLLAAGCERLPFRWFWPEGHTAAIILTHDVEGEDGARRMIEIANLEEEVGFRSSFNVGAWYALDRGVVRELGARGFEIGVHGLRHDRTMFSSRAAFEASLPGLRALAETVGAVGFRSPSTHRAHAWLRELPLDYDTSVPHSDPYEPQPGGCCSVWPFFLGSVLELPYTLPQDHTLFTLLGHDRIDLWLQLVDRIERAHGLVQCVSHPDRGYLGDRQKRELYAEFLRGVAARDGLWRALPRDVSAWWRSRVARGDDPRARLANVVRDDAAGEAALEPPAPSRRGPGTFDSAVGGA